MENGCLFFYYFFYYVFFLGHYFRIRVEFYRDAFEDIELLLDKTENLFSEVAYL